MSIEQKKPLRSFEESVMAGTPVFVGDALRRGLGGIGTALKKPLVLLPAALLLLVQTALSFIKPAAPDSVLVDVLSMLTFAQGGMYAGFFGALGGIIGKMLLSVMLTRLFMGKTGRQSKKTQPRGGSAALLLPGVGAGLIAYNFLTGNACLGNAMIGVTGAISVFRMAGNSQAFLPGFVRSFRKGKIPPGTARFAMLGCGAGLCVGVLSSLLTGGVMCYVLGAVLLIVGLVLALITKSKRGAAAAAALLICLSPLTGFVTTARAEDFAYTSDQASQVDTDEVAAKLNADFPETLSVVPVAVIHMTWMTAQNGVVIPHIPAQIGSAQPVALINGTGRLEFIDEATTLSSDSTTQCDSVFGTRVDFEEWQTTEYGWDEIEIFDVATGQWMGNSVAGERDTFSGSGLKDGNEVYFAGNPDVCGAYSIALHQALSQKKSVYLVVTSQASIILCEVLSAGLPVETLPGQKPGSETQSGDGMWQLTDTVAHIDEQSLDLDDEWIEPSFDETGYTCKAWLYDPYPAEYVDMRTDVTFTSPPETALPGDKLEMEIGCFFSILTDPFAPYGKYDVVWLGFDKSHMTMDDFQDDAVWFAWDSINEAGPCEQPVFYVAEELFSFPDGRTAFPAYEQSTVKYTLEYGPRTYMTDEDAAVWTDEFVDGISTGVGYMPSPDTYGNECSLYIGTQNMTLEFVYTWTGSVPPAQGQTYGDGTEPQNEEDLPQTILYDENGFFDGDYWVGWDELFDRTNAVGTAVIDGAALTGGVLAALLAAGGAMGGGSGGASGGVPPLPDSPYIKRDPNDPACATLTGPGGVQSLYRYDEASGLWRDPYSDSYLEPSQIDRAMKDAQRDREFSEGVMEQMEGRTDAASMRQKQMFKMEQQEERLWATGGTYGGALEKRLADQLKNMRRQMIAGQELDTAKYEKVRNAIGKLSRGEMKNESFVSTVPDDRWSPGEIKAALELTGREIGTSSSWKAWALRGLMAVGTGGASEKIFDLTDAAYTMHDSYMAGDSEGTAFAKAVGSYVTGELIGEAAGAGLKKVGGAVADTKVGQKALHYVKDMMDPAAKQADDAAKAAKRLAVAKDAPNIKMDAAPKLASKPQLELEPPKPKSESLFDPLQSDRHIDSVKKNAQRDIQKKLDALRAKQGTDPMQTAANQKAAGKVDKLQKALSELKNDPGDPAKRRTAEEAAMAVQRDKAGIRQMKQAGDVPPESRQVFNAMKTQKDQIATANTREILAKKFGVKPEDIKSIEPSNTMTTSELRQIGEADGVYRQPATGSAQGAKRFDENDFPLDTEKASKTGVSSDIDKTMRIEVEELDPRTGKTVVKQYDIPASEVKSVYEEEFYRCWHGGELPSKTVDGKIVTDTEAIERFAKEMDVSCNDKVSTESYSDLVEAMKKSGVKDFSDVEATSLTTAHKSNEWFRRAEVLEQNAGGDLDVLSQAENLRAEGIRQATKQFDNLTMRQAREINLAKGIERAKVPDTLIQRMEVLKRVDQLPPDGISTHEAEAILNQMGTSTEKVLEQFYAVTEMLNKWK